MNKYELLLEKIKKAPPVIELPLIDKFESEGFFFENAIFIDSSLSDCRKYEILAEEYSHYKTSVGNIIDCPPVESSNREWRACRYSIEVIISLDDLIDCYNNGMVGICECAEYLSVSEDLLRTAIKHYYNRFGRSRYYNGKHFHFDKDSIRISCIYKIDQTPQ